MMRLTNKNGFSLSETLITVLLMSIILSFITVGIIVVRDSYLKIVQKADGMTLLSTIAMGMEADFNSADNVRYWDETIENEDGTSQTKTVIRFKSGIRGYDMSFDTVNDQICVVAYAESNAKQYIPVATLATHTNKLKSELSSLSYNFEKGYFEYKITIKAKSNDSVVVEEEYATRVEK